MEHDVAVGAHGDSTKPVLWMAMELSLSKWKLGFSDGSARAARVVTIEARDYAALEQQIARARRAFDLSETSKVRSLYEAGREGFSVHRRLEQLGIENPLRQDSCRLIETRLWGRVGLGNDGVHGRISSADGRENDGSEADVGERAGAGGRRPPADPVAVAAGGGYGRGRVQEEAEDEAIAA